MKIQLNGEDYSTEARTIAELLKENDIIPERVAIELNLNVVKKERYGDTEIKEGDEIEVVSFVGGGCSDTENIRTQESYTTVKGGR